MSTAAFHIFVRDPQPIPFDLLECERCGWPIYQCACDDELPAYRGSDPSEYPKETK